MKISDIPAKRLKELNLGLSQTANLVEWLAVDQSKLLRSVAEQCSVEILRSLAAKLPQVSTAKQIAWIGQQISDIESLSLLDTHTSDVVRCWSCYARAVHATSLKEALDAMKPFADDRHFGLREIAWLSVRNRICDDPLEALTLLSPWTKHSSEYIRRFASEATRPRGVWAKHIVSFKKDPSPARSLLDQLQSDGSRYVQDSVANWLNDAAKDHPMWVKDVVKTWAKKSKSSETGYIIKRATRSIS